MDGDMIFKTQNVEILTLTLIISLHISHSHLSPYPVNWYIRRPNIISVRMDIDLTVNSANI